WRWWWSPSPITRWSSSCPAVTTRAIPRSGRATSRPTAASAMPVAAWPCRPGTTCGSSPTCGHTRWRCGWAWRLAGAQLERAGNALDRFLSGWGLLLWPAAALAALRLLLHPRFGSTHALVDDWYNHAQYFGVF